MRMQERLGHTTGEEDCEIPKERNEAVDRTHDRYETDKEKGYTLSAAFLISG